LVEKDVVTSVLEQCNIAPGAWFSRVDLSVDCVKPAHMSFRSKLCALAKACLDAISASTQHLESLDCVVTPAVISQNYFVIIERGMLLCVPDLSVASHRDFISFSPG